MKDRRQSKEMTNRKGILSQVVILILVCVILSGCTTIISNDITREPNTQNTTNNSNESNSSSTSNAISDTVTLGAKDISNADLNVYYNEIMLNGQTSLEELSTQLHIPIGEVNENCEIVLACNYNDMNYGWYKVSYPNKEHAEFIFDYLYNTSLKTGRIVSIDLKKVPTKRGIVVGDNLDKIKLAYGNDIVSEYNSDTTENIRFKVNNYELCYTYEKSTGTILEIDIDFDSNQAMDEIDIPSLID
jgi:uncharacterized protein YceK